MAIDKNKAIARLALEGVWSAAGTASLEEVYSAQFVSHQQGDPDATVRGIEALKSFIAEFHLAFPDFNNQVEQQIAEDDRVVTAFTSSGTHRGALMGVASTGKRIEWSGIEIVRVEGGKIAENWVIWDRLGVLEQMGVAVLPG